MIIFIHGELEKNTGRTVDQKDLTFIDIGLSNDCYVDLNKIVNGGEKLKLIVTTPHLMFASLIKHSDDIVELARQLTEQIGNIVKFYRQNYQDTELFVIGKEGCKDNSINKNHKQFMSKLIDSIEPSLSLAAHHLIETNDELKKSVNYLFACTVNDLSSCVASSESLIKEVKKELNEKLYTDKLEKDLDFQKKENKHILNALFSLQEKAEISFKKNYLDKKIVKVKDENIQNLKDVIKDYKERIYKENNIKSWLLLSLLESRGTLWSKSLKFRRSLAQKAAEIENNNFFDEEYYLEKNNDLKDIKLRPSVHYLLFGQFEGRDPSKDFSTLTYIKYYSDVAKSSSFPLFHYLKYGVEEKRLPNPTKVHRFK